MLLRLEVYDKQQNEDALAVNDEGVPCLQEEKKKEEEFGWKGEEEDCAVASKHDGCEGLLSLSNRTPSF